MASSIVEAHAGYLTFRKPGRVKGKQLPNSWCKLYCGKSNFPPRLDIFEDETKQSPKKSIDIEDAKWGKTDTLEPSFCIHIKSKRYMFITKTTEERNTWFQLLCCLSIDLNKSHKDGDGQAEDDDNVIMRDNCLYTSSSDVSQFDVVADQHGKCLQLGFKGLMRLCFDSQNIQLFEMNDEHPVAEWSYYCIRSFGNSKYVLNISVGTKSSTGQGKFDFNSVEAETMVGLIDTYTKRIRGQENQFPHASLNGNNAVTTETLGEKKMGSAFSISPTSPKTKVAPGIPSPKPVFPSPKPVIPSPKPTSPPPSQSPSSGKSNAFDAQFTKELSRTIGIHGDGGAQPLERKASNDSHGSIDKKESKKSLKEKEKIAKRKAKEREKQEKEKQKQLEKHKKKEEKEGREKLPVPRKSSAPQALQDAYSEAYDHQAEKNDVYSECSFPTDDTLPTNYDEDSKVYNEPWGPLKIGIVMPNKANNGDDDYDDASCLYSSPVLLDSRTRTIETKVEDSYEDVGVSSAPPIIPPKFLNDGDDSNNNIYDHFVAPIVNVPDQPDNVYGLESAQPMSNNVKRDPPPSNPHSDIYESID